MKRFSILLLITAIVVSCEDRNEQNGPGTTLGVSGFVQKGPFVSGSNIIVQVLDEDFNPTGQSFTVTTIDDFGSFSLESEVSGVYVEFIAQGFYFDEVKGEISSAGLTLRALSRVTADLKSNVNVLTTLSKNRIIELVKGGKSFDDAKTQAQQEILNNFNIVEEGSDFNSMDISANGSQNAVLLAISSILQGNQTVGELSELISKIILDVQDNGIIDTQTVKDKIYGNANALNLASIKTNLINRYAELGVQVAIPEFEKFAKRLISITIVKSIPANEEKSVRYDIPYISIYYNKALSASTINGDHVKLLDASGVAVTGQVSYDADSFKIKFTPSAELLPEKTYKLKITSVATLDGTDAPDSESSFSTLNIDIVSNLLAYYPLDGDANDASGHGLHATAVNTTFGTDAISIQACKFSGEGSYLEIPNVMNLTEKVWTYSIWFKLDQLPDGVAPFLLATRLSGNSFWDLPLYIRPSAKTITTYNESVLDIGANTVNLDTWHLMTLVINNGTIQMYYDGVLKASRDNFWSHQSNPNYPDFMGDATGSYEFYTGYYYISEKYRGEVFPAYMFGSVDNVRFYNRALNKYEVLKLYTDHQ